MNTKISPNLTFEDDKIEEMEIENTMENNLKIEDRGEFQTKLESRNKLSYLIISFTFGLSSVTDLAIKYYFKDFFKVQPAEMSRLDTIISIPWFIKPLFGLITDLIPICEYRRKIYIILCGLLDFACLFGISLIEESIFLFVTFLFLHNSCLSFITVLGEAIVVELSKVEDEEEKASDGLNVTNYKNFTKAKNYVSYFFFVKYLGSFISSIFKGLMIKYFEFSTIFLIGSLIPFLFVISGCIFIEDININKQNKINLDSHEINEKVNNEGVEILQSNQYYNLNEVNNVIIKEKKFPKKISGFLFQKHIILPILFMIFLLATPRYLDQMFYFHTEILHLDSVDLGILSIFFNISSLSGIAIYNYCLKNRSFRSVITFGILMTFLFSFFSYFLVKRFNLLLNIPDFPFILLSNCLTTIIRENILMPIYSLAALLSPKDFEGTSFSIFMSACNLGATISNLFDSILTSLLNINNRDLSNLPLMIIISNFIILIHLPILYCIKKSYFEFKDIYNKNEIIEMNEKKNQEIKGEIEL